ncbi:CooT family nickel-binding protein [Pseudoflavonifractor sp. 60]|uniref:CooT family nickel-binding protein n=1 Tax=Pseudoflavonifractor sp. 60 TaxID=2304576 RepID=UPI00136BEB5C|nr:CooT family nickel-binding protein [Pseudoflavonifractor sp. 60]NBI68674.1 CooT family nickel-binding protein [Pseudoflavonifractor sp. 60]
MCLSTIYRGERHPSHIVLKNVAHIRCEDGMVIFTDLMDRKMAVEGEILEADMISGYFIVKESAAS